MIFLTLEDDTAVSNVVVWPKVFARFRKEVMAGRLLHVKGKLQREGTVTHVIATQIVDYSYLLDGLGYPEFAGDSIDPSRDSNLRSWWNYAARARSRLARGGSPSTPLE